MDHADESVELSAGRWGGGTGGHREVHNGRVSASVLKLRVSIGWTG